VTLVQCFATIEKPLSIGEIHKGRKWITKVEQVIPMQRLGGVKTLVVMWMKVESNDQSEFRGVKAVIAMLM
jgi:hypothetical protein